MKSAFITTDPVITMYYAPDGEGNYTAAPVGPLFLWGTIFIRSTTSIQFFDHFQIYFILPFKFKQKF